MELNDAIEIALQGDAVLFVGSGFSKGATNIIDDNFKTGYELLKYLSDKISINEDIDLSTASEIYIDKFGSSTLINKLQQLYTAKDVSKAHTSICSIKWKRIYTTNYDDVLEVAYSKNNKKLSSISLTDDPKQFSSRNNVCLHINGFINSLSQESLFSSFKLIDSSYLSESFADSDWAYIFRKDIRLSRAIFFIGYSLYDLDIARILYQDKSLKNKCFFINGENPSQVTTYKLSKFGEIIPLDMGLFAKKIIEKKKTWNPAINTVIFSSFLEYTVPQKHVEIRDDDVIRLMLYGDINVDNIWESLIHGSTSQYYIERPKLDFVIDAINNHHKNILITSRVANGKTLLIEGIKAKCASNGYDIYTLFEQNDNAENEIEHICKSGNKTIIVVENYHRYLELIKHIAQYRNDNTVLILSARTEINDFFLEKLEITINYEPIFELNIDNLEISTIEKIVDLLDTYGLWGADSNLSKARKISNIRGRLNCEFQNILIKIFESPDVRKRFEKLIESLRTSGDFRKIIVLSCILKSLNYTPYQHVFIELLNIEQSVISHIKRNIAASQFANINFDIIELKSTTLARFILNSLEDSNLVVDVLIEAAKKADSLSKYDKFYKYLYRELSRYGNLHGLLPEKQRRSAIIKFYESIKNLYNSARNPNFWLQYAIARLSFPDLKEAKIYIDTAYSYASNIPNYSTAQIDNHYARYLLEVSKETPDSNEAFKLFNESHSLLHKQILNEKVHHPYRVACGYEKFYLQHFDKISADNKKTFIANCQIFIDRIEKLPKERRYNRYVKKCFSKLSLLISQS